MLKELSDLPKEQADQKVCRHLKAAIETYNKTLAENMPYYNKVLEENKKYPEKGKQIEFTSYFYDGRITIPAIRYKVLALVLIAGKLNLPESSKYVDKVLEIALEQRKTFYNTDVFNTGDAVNMLIDGSLYSRPILATALLGTCSNEETVQKILQQSGKKMVNFKLTAYNAAATPFERTGRVTKTDYSKGSMDIKFVEPLTDSEFDKIVKDVRILKGIPADMNNPK